MMLLPRTIGPFTLLRRLGSSAVAESYVGRMHTRGDETVVVRRVLPFLLKDPQRLASTESRVRDLLGVRHPFLVQILDWVVDGSERFTVEGWVDGIDLERILQWCRAQHQPLPPNVFLNLATQICNGLEALHGRPGLGSGAHNVLHLALAPQAILVTREGKVVIGSFGLIRSPATLPHGGLSSTSTRLEYLSPEQTVSDEELSPASDIFALGALLYELATLEPLFLAPSNLQTVNNVRKAEVAERLDQLRASIPGLDKILARALARNPRHRYHRAFVLREDLRGLMAGYTFNTIVEDTRRFLVPLFGGQAGGLGPADVGSERGAANVRPPEPIPDPEAWADEGSTLVAPPPLAPSAPPPPPIAPPVLDDLALDPPESLPIRAWSDAQRPLGAPPAPLPESGASAAFARLIPPPNARLPLPLADPAPTPLPPPPDLDLNDHFEDTAHRIDAAPAENTAGRLPGPTALPPMPQALSRPPMATSGNDTAGFRLGSLQPPPSPEDLPPTRAVYPALLPAAPALAAPAWRSDSQAASERPTAPVPPRSESLPPPPPLDAPEPPPALRKAELPTTRQEAAGPALRALPPLPAAPPPLETRAPTAATPPTNHDLPPRPKVPAPATRAPAVAPAERNEDEAPPNHPTEVPAPTPRKGGFGLMLGVGLVAALAVVFCAGGGFLAFRSFQAESEAALAGALTEPTDGEPSSPEGAAAPEAAPPPNEAPEAEALPDEPAAEPDAGAPSPSDGTAELSEEEPSPAEAPAPSRSSSGSPSTARSAASDASRGSSGDPQPTNRNASSASASRSSSPGEPIESEPIPVGAGDVDMDGLSRSAEAGRLSPSDIMALETIGLSDTRYTRSRTLLAMDARKKRQPKLERRYLEECLRLEENRYSPVILVDLARSDVNMKRFSEALNRADTAERYWARIPPEVMFEKKAQIFETGAAAAQGLLYKTDNESQQKELVDDAIRRWQRYRQHVAAGGKPDLVARADTEIAKLEDVKRRIQ